ncbi:hypothetical protein DVH05_003204 [Phytophthora capsici]|nr:hypothetical protein DVH05_003204 [Phytophthora capsici]
MMTVACLLPYIAPFETIRTVLKTRSGASIPFGMCLAGATSNLIWTIEGLYTDDMFILFLSAACSALGFVQVALYLVFRPRKAEKALEVDVTGTAGKSALPITSQPAKMEKDVCHLPVMELMQTRCLGKIEIISPATLVPVIS